MTPCLRADMFCPGLPPPSFELRWLRCPCLGQTRSHSHHAGRCAIGTHALTFQNPAMRGCACRSRDRGLFRARPAFDYKHKNLELWRGGQSEVWKPQRTMTARRRPPRCGARTGRSWPKDRRPCAPRRLQCLAATHWNKSNLPGRWSIRRMACCCGPSLQMWTWTILCWRPVPISPPALHLARRRHARAVVWRRRLMDRTDGHHEGRNRLVYERL